MWLRLNNSKINVGDWREGKEVMTERILNLLIETTNNRKIRKIGGHKMNQTMHFRKCI
jgi:hypothetical protein